MDRRTDEQKAADDALDAAIRRVVELAEGYAGELVVDWLVGYVCADADDVDRSIYGYAFAGGSMPTYRALGIVRMVELELEGRGVVDDDDDGDEGA